MFASVLHAHTNFPNSKEDDADYWGCRLRHSSRKHLCHLPGLPKVHITCAPATSKDVGVQRVPGQACRKHGAPRGSVSLAEEKRFASSKMGKRTTERLTVNFFFVRAERLNFFHFANVKELDLQRKTDQQTEKRPGKAQWVKMNTNHGY